MDEKKKEKDLPWEHRDQNPPKIILGGVPPHIEKKLREALEKHTLKTRK
jgi:hypothetical protein